MMSTSEQNLVESRPKRRLFLRIVQVLVTLFNGWVTVQVWMNGRGNIWILFGWFFICSLISLVFRMGWLIPCVIIGIHVGILADVGVKSGPRDAQMWQTVYTIIFWMIAGLVVGLILDAPGRAPHEKIAGLNRKE